MGDPGEPFDERTRARRELYQLACLVVRRSHRAAGLARTLRALHPHAARALPPRELRALATLVVERLPGWSRGLVDRRADGPATILEAMPPRMADAVRRAGIGTDRDITAKTCALLMAHRGIGPKTARALLGASVSARLKLACGCGWSGAGLAVCERGRRHGLEL